MIKEGYSNKEMTAERVRCKSTSCLVLLTFFLLKLVMGMEQTLVMVRK